MARLDLRIEGPPGAIALTVLARALTNSASILSDLGRAVTHTRGKVTWYVEELRTASADVTLVSEPTSDVDEAGLERIARAYVNGMRLIQSGESLPAYMSERSLRRVQEIAQPLGQGAEAFSATVLANGHSESVTVTHEAAANLRILMSPRTRALGSVTGRLEAVTLHQRLPKFYVYDDVGNRPVGCHFPESHLETVTAVLGKHVRVTGVVVRNAKGQAMSVEDPSISEVGEGRPLSDLLGLDSGFLGKKSLSEYMDEVLG